MSAPEPYPLDRPAWSALTTRLASMAEGAGRARRIDREVNVFGALQDESREALADLAGLVRPGETVYLVQVPEIPELPGLHVLKRARCVQMLATRPLGGEVREAGGQDGILALGDDDAPEMLSLAQLTEPGPFLPRTHTMGEFIGVREHGTHGRLIAMAGERFRLPGYTEVSAICTHPDARGRGLARRLSAVVTANIQARGEQPFLHAWTTNRAAIALYETLGFVVRTEVHVAVLERPL